MGKKRGITVDNGGSEVRVASVEDAYLADMILLNNDFVTIDESDFRVKEVERPELLCRVLEAPREEYKGIIAQGLTGKAYENTSINISSQETKTGCLNYYKQFIFSVAQDALKAYKQEIKDGAVILYLDEATYDYAIVTCIPIKEFNGSEDCAQLLKSNLAGKYVVEFPLLEKSPKVAFTISERYTGVVPEGAIAVKALKGSLDEDDVTLVIDIGHVTTDIALFQGESLLGKVKSSTFAGSTLIANLRQALADEGYILTEKQVERVIATGCVKKGVLNEDVSEIISKQRKDFVKNYLQNEVIEVLNMNRFNAKQVQNFVPLGAVMNIGSDGGSMQDDLIEACNLVHAEVKLLADDLRYVNIEQAQAFTRRLFNKMMKEEA